MDSEIVRPRGGESLDRLRARVAVIAAKKNRNVSYQLINSTELNMMTPGEAAQLLKDEWIGEIVLGTMGEPYGPLCLTPRQLKKFIPRKVFLKRLRELREVFREAKQDFQKAERLERKTFGRS